MRNALVGGRGRGLWAAARVTTSNLLQGLAVMVGVGALIVASQRLFTAIKWAGVAYLLFLASRTLRSAIRGEYDLSVEGALAVIRAAGTGAEAGGRP